MYQEMYAQHQRLRDTMLASPYQRAVSSPSAPPTRPQASAPLGWNISSPNYRDLGVVGSGAGLCLCVACLSCPQVLTDDSGVSTLAA